ncbi:Protein CBG25307 [Caenorhabditis briggsae]|uniref:Protein CBG25307 n=1 Tax=Caenorhabditis briggsae TaxID=6238 RepID=B6IIH7_CAEBR|nr:Protein CBG25307 [Caenorhabditis briggsae]CAR99707.1 Protein CBG25307 [Caenorhabditis briggsae]
MPLLQVFSKLACCKYDLNEKLKKNSRVNDIRRCNRLVNFNALVYVRDDSKICTFQNPNSGFRKNCSIPNSGFRTFFIPDSEKILFSGMKNSGFRDNYLIPDSVLQISFL